MNRLTLHLVPLLLLLSVSAQAEPAIGGKGGVNFAKWVIQTSQPVTIDRTHKSGMIVGGYLQFRHFQNFVPQLELMFSQRGTANEQYGEGLGYDRLNYIDLALLVRMELSWSKVTLYGLLGPELSGLLTATTVNRGGDGTDIKDDLRAFDIGALAGIGIVIGPFSWGTLTFEIRADRGLINIATAIEDVTLTNQTIAFLVGYEYRRDRDHDGIADSKDRCPRQAEDRDGFEDSDGCPDADHDSAEVTRYP